MRLMITGRAGGKTTEALRQLDLHPSGIMVCATEREAQRCRELADENADRIIGPSDLAKLKGGRGPVLIDNLDWLLAIEFGIGDRDVWASLTGDTQTITEGSSV